MLFRKIVDKTNAEIMLRALDKVEGVEKGAGLGQSKGDLRLKAATFGSQQSLFDEVNSPSKEEGERGRLSKGSCSTAPDSATA